MTIDNLTDSAAALDPQAREILDFWFGEPDSAAFGHARKVWFNGGAAFDDVLRTRYGALLDAACDGACDHWADTPLGALALIVVLDQFSRNIHRGTPRAFAADPRALALARRVVAAGWDAQLPSGHHRAFAYLPFEHDESDASQREAVRLCAGIRGEAGCASYHDFALRHAAVIGRFGRFPHRNAILGRASTDAEAAFLREPGSSF
ncbi:MULTISPECIES: DUF924 family protein [unclassified Burkholderia]|uniref:DUF924 family protein n=1 Tax=unclassified Burkholderia TaxID=2613784 RepID=UPI0005CF78EE|nr:MULTISPECIES: DUF924 family protein [unclassified Burkholderia]RQR38265.1 DUF924 domain-containing protein [Burkholderia sp. Bp9131]RQR73455.1 DUF924 domain-containing protein [Burkholderia sp. Bp9015]RQR82089.1 DUF924 domain-containing protein [Burkholderia sp. Bp9011]RQR91720.1 DUF924 domain-containing protein [Burkholderia sp. Bp9010]RQR91932.1 DUF924 domain-containing protein [Burkholderia sp. Bp8994]